MPANVVPKLLLHVGCGKLAVGAVIPFLHLQFPKSRLLIMQRASEEWADLADGELVVFRNTGGFHRVYPVIRIGTPSDLQPKLKAFFRDRQLGAALLIVPSISYAGNLIDRVPMKVVLSCSLGDGQRDLVNVLRPIPKKLDRVLVFENTLAVGWKALVDKHVAHHIVVDRICPATEHKDSKKANKGSASKQPRTAVFKADCEKGYCSFTWSARLSGVLRKRFASKSDSAIELGFDPAPRLYCVEDIELEQKKKRAMVNATHAIMTMLVCRVLAEREMATKNQYLAPLYAYMAREKPEWVRALDTYIRMRALILVLHDKYMKLQGEETCQAAFDRLYQLGSQAKDRFIATADLIERGFSGKDLAKDIGKATEHIVDPFREYREIEVKCETAFKYRRPDRVEIAHLKDFLDSSFLTTMAWLSENE